MRTTTAYAPVTEVDRGELDRQIANRYRDVANETAPDLHFPTERPLAQGLGYPNDLLTRLPTEAVSTRASYARGSRNCHSTTARSTP